MHSLIAHFQPYLPLKAGEQEMISNRATQRKVKRGQLILQEGYPSANTTHSR